jgi:hypothetical protein
VQAHGAIVEGGDDPDAGPSGVVTVANIGVLATQALQSLNPKLAKQIPKGLDAKLVELGEGGPATEFTVTVEGFHRTALELMVLALVLFAAAVFLAPDRRRAITRTGLAIAAVGLLILLAYEASRAIVLSRLDAELDRNAIAGLWDAMLGTLADWNLALAGVGAVIAGAGAAVLPTVDAVAPLRRLAELVVTTPESTGWRAVRAIALVGAGLLMVLEPQWVLNALLVLAGLLVISVGVSELVRLTSPAKTDAVEEEVSVGRRRRLGALAIGAAAIAAIVTVALIAIPSDDEPRAAGNGCNGSVKLCERTLDEVVFPASHNSMSAAAYPGYLFPMHERAIPDQLEHGVRALLIDAYYGAPGRRVYTDFSQIPNKLVEQARDQFGPQFVAAADRLRNQLVRPDPGESDNLYLCHGFCELGAIDLVDTLSAINDFLEGNPREVLLIDIEDYVEPQDIVGAFEESGLAERVYDGPLEPDFPTLGEMIDADKRVIVLAENRAGAADWYHPAYDELFQETGFDFKEPAEMGCAPNRGKPTNPLFLINHWINTDPAAKPSNAKIVNDYDFLLDRARRCARKRGLTPNVIAVDFEDQGNLIDVAERLNR